MVKPRSLAEIQRHISPVPDFIEGLFQGEMGLRTKCLDCEHYTERKEEYQDISVPVKKEGKPWESESEEDEEDGNDSCSSRVVVVVVW